MAQAAANANERPRAWGLIVADPWLLLCVLALVAIGVVMVYSASSSLAIKRHGQSAYFLWRQLANVGLCLPLMIVLAYIDYDRLRRWAMPIYFLVLAMLVLVLIPGVGHTSGGAARWLRPGGFSIQPAELAKPALVLCLAHALSLNHDRIRRFWRGFVFHMALALALILPVLLEPDLGMCIMLFAITFAMLFVAGVRLSFLGGMVLAAAPVIWVLIVNFPYRFARVIAFLDPWRYRQSSGFQVIHSFLAFGSGGLGGVGLGSSTQKLFYLPEPHTDFIFSVIGEELGLWGVTLVLGLFLTLIWRGVKISLAARDIFGTFLAAGATAVIGIQAFVNAGVVMGLLPTTGLTLPFISAGGSSMMTSFTCVGLLLSVAAHNKRAA
ncbi:cell division protein FtsW [Desulfarculus baarsii DSM 2075]|uniref:Probable peptidoglycan glycosyltransferase FtsW n=1 Tax=Desulfarculus baarsii (strain ATCC 33931 / DSM 2075 / LMG 7858 / VKM B-1802 / 2st14) TaxID=644282 RepID=E1QMA3_DESB2|nr:putative lipid II flippase FtsW [Desulfarculus baarsii]ADK86146.1 cell division protein FtsW [Desulfarculus baarsii DSM 2075]